MHAISRFIMCLQLKNINAVKGKRYGNNARDAVIFAEYSGVRGKSNGRFAERARRNVKDCRAMYKMCSSEKRNFAPN